MVSDNNCFHAQKDFGLNNFQHLDCQCHDCPLEIAPWLTGRIRELNKETSDTKRKTHEINDVDDSIGYRCESSERSNSLPRTQNCCVNRNGLQLALLEKQWYGNFHLSKGTVLYIVNEVEDDITHTDSKLWKAFPAFQRVALTIYFMASTAEYRSETNLFEVSRSFVSLCAKEVCQAIVRRLKSRYITIPKGDD